MYLPLFDSPTMTMERPCVTIAKPASPALTFTARDYQQRGIDEAFRLWLVEGKKGVVLRLPTGCGKTLTGSLIANRWLSLGDDYRVLVVAHERQLIQQFAQEIEDILGERPAIEMGDQHCSGRDRITVASRQTLRIDETDSGENVSRLFKFDPSLNWLLIIDEAHRWARKLKACRPIIEYFEQNPNHRRLGLTATPERTDKTSLEGLFPGIASDYRLYDVRGGSCAVNDGWAVPYDQRFIVVEGVDFRNIPELAKDFNTADLERILSESETLEKLCKPMLDLVGKRRTIIFNPGTAMAKQVAMFLNAKAGHEVAMSLDGSYPDDERQDIYKRHQRGDFQFLSVCGLCREGYNDPGIGAVAVFRPTKSRPLAEQMKGRGCRPLRGVVSSDMTAEQRLAAIAASDKPNCMIIDLVGVTGMADCASTASIMAEGFSDEVIDLANKNMLAKPVDEASDVAEEIIKAEAAIEKSRKEREERLLQAKLEREERRRKEQEEMNRRAKLRADVRYEQRQVGHGGGGASAERSKGELASSGQLRYLHVLGMRGDWSHLTKKQAGRMITQLKNQGLSPEQVARMSPRAKQPQSEQREPRNFSVDDINRLLMEASRS